MDAEHVVMTVTLLSFMPVALIARRIGMALDAKFAPKGEDEE